MNILQALILGIVQGLTEFLPISSSGHLVLIPKLFGWEYQSLAFDTVLHLGTALALVIYFYKDLLEVIKSKKLILLLLIGSIPAGVLGLFFNDYFEFYFRTTNWVVTFLLVGSVVMWLAEKSFSKVWNNERVSDFSKITNKKAFIIGMFQSLALFPGMSRSGSSISGGMLLGLSREAAARFSFLLAIPAVVAATLFKLVDSSAEISFDLSLLVGFLSSFLVGLVAIKFLLNFLKSNSLNSFILYRIVLSLILIVSLFF